MSNKLTGGARGSRVLLTRILGQPDLVAAVQALPPRALGKLIDHVGLEDSGEIVALATTDQIRRIFDDDLWRNERPGLDETFDAERFALWLEVMLEGGEEFAAQMLAGLPEDLVTLALQKHVLVINIDELAVTMSDRQSDDDALTEKALESCLCEEIAEFRIIALKHDGWDAIVSVLLALDRDHHDFLQRVLEHCCYLASEYIEENGGLFDVLTSGQMLEADVAGEREDRRAEEGFVAPSAAASFLALARISNLGEIMQAKPRDPITQAYFRGRQAGTKAFPARTKPDEPEAAGGAGDAARLVQVLRDAEVLPPSSPLRLLEAKSPEPPEEFAELISRAIRHLATNATELHSQRMQELAYLANVLVAGCTIENRSFRPVEAARAAVATCNLGLDHLVQGKTAGATATELVKGTGADQLFRIGWRLLYQDVIAPAARRLERFLASAATHDLDEPLSKEVGRAATVLHSALAAGKPWSARGKLAPLCESIDKAPLTALLSLLDECPHPSGRLLVNDEGGTGAEMAFISTCGQLARVKAFLAELDS